MRLLILLLISAAISWSAAGRIVSTSPSVTETLFALGLGDNVVGVSMHCAFPEKAKSLPKVGSYIRPDVETIVRLRPDLVILRDSNTTAAERLTVMRIRVLQVRIDSLQQMRSAIESVAAAVGVPEKGKQLRARIDQDLERIRARAETAGTRKIAFVVGRTPGRLEGIVVAGRGSYLDEVMTIGGGTNIFGDSLTPWPRVSLESILRADPDIVVDMGEMAKTSGVTAEQIRRVQDLWRERPLRAARTGRVYAVADDIYVVPGPRVVQAALAFARMLHPEVKF
jgi:iron complex transport system substrate-binding protein